MTRQFIISFACFLWISGHTWAQQKFACDGNSYISVVEAGQTSFYELFLSDIGLEQALISSNFDASINSVGYNPKDSLIYGIDSETNRLYRLWADGTVEALQFIPLQGDYFAGDIHPSGDRLILLNSDSIAIIHIEKMETPVEYVPISTMDSSNIFTTDIAYHPVTGVLYGYDGLQGKLITIDDSSGLVDNLTYPNINFNDGIPALFFDPRGELFGIGNNNANQESILFNFDLNTGIPSRSAFQGAFGDRDGCSCPYTLKVFQKVNNPFLAPCSEMEIVLTISNLVGGELNNFDLIETLPDGYIIEEFVSNPYSGTVVSGIGENELHINNIAIPYGVDSIKMIVSIPESAGGETHSIQAQLSGFTNGTNVISTLVSNDLLQTEKNSPTIIKVQEVEDIFDDQIPALIELCEGDTFNLVLPSSEDFSYEWSDGLDIEARPFFSSEELTLDVISVCERITFPISIQETAFSVDLGEDITANLGEFIVLDPVINSLSPIDSFVWKTINGDIPCDFCSSIQVQANTDIKYILVATNANGCKSTDEINLFVDRDIYAPNVFSPNGDGFNDYFHLFSSFPSIEIMDLTIYNRWGAKVFSIESSKTNEELAGWNGKINGAAANAGSYIWTATAVFNDRKAEKITGTILLVR